MWNRLSQAAGFSTTNDDDEAEETEQTAAELHEQTEQQKQVLEQLKTLVRENETKFKEKEKELEELSTKFQRFQLQSKAKITNLNNQLKEKLPKKDEGDFDDSSSDSSDQSTKGKILLLKKQLESAKKMVGKKEKEIENISKNYEKKIEDLEGQLKEKLSPTSSKSDDLKEKPPDMNVQEMYAQIVYKDSKILDLNNQILELEKKMLDLQEHIKEKNEVLQTRNLAVQLMSADMNRKGKTVVDELQETREQMKLMQSNFTDAEGTWKRESDKLKLNIEDLSEKLLQKDKTLQDLKAEFQKNESSRMDLATRNAELSKKIVLVEEKAKKQCENYRKDLDVEFKNLQQSLKLEHERSIVLQKSLDETNSQSESKIFKARVKERTKSKAIERELAALKQTQAKETKPSEEIIHLQQQVAVLEEEKGSLQLKLIDVDEQLALQEELKSKNDALETSLTESLEQIQILRKEAEVINNKITRLETENESAVQFSKEIKVNFEKLSEENVSDKTKVNELSHFVTDLEVKLDILSTSENEWKEQYNATSVEIQSLKDEKVSLEMKAIELEEILERMAKEKEQLEKRIDTLQADSPESSIQLEQEKLSLEMHCKELDKTIKCTENTEKQLREKIKEQNSAYSDLTNHLSQVQDVNCSFETQNQMLQDCCKALEAKLSDLQNRVEEKALDDNKKSELYQEQIRILQEEKNRVLKTLSAANIEDFQEIWSSYMHSMTNVQQKLTDECESSEQLKKELADKNYAIEINVRDLELAIDKLEMEKTQNLTHVEEKEKLSHTIEELLKEKDEISQVLFEKTADVENLTIKLTESKNEYDALIVTESEKDKEFVKLTEVLNQKDEELRSLNDSVQEKVEQFTLLEQEKDTALEKINNLQQQLNFENNSAKMKMASLLEQISDLEEEIVRMNEELEAKESILADTMNNLTHLEAKMENCNQAFNEKFTSYQNSFQQKDQAFHLLQEELLALKNEHSTKERECEKKCLDFTNRCQTLTAEHEFALKDLSNQNQNLVEKIEQQKGSSIAELEDVRQNLELLTKNKAELEEFSIAQREKAESEVNSLNEQLDQFKKEIQMLQEQITVYNSSVSERDSLFASTVQEKSSLEMELSKLQETLQVMNSSNIELKNQNSSLLSDIESMQTEYWSLKSELDATVRQLSLKDDELKSLIVEKQTSVNELSMTISKLESQLKNAHLLTNEANDIVKQTKQDARKIKEERNNLLESLSVETKHSRVLQEKVKEYDEMKIKHFLHIGEHTNLINSLKQHIEEMQGSKDKSQQELCNKLAAMSSTNQNLENSLSELKLKIDEVENEKNVISSEKSNLESMVHELTLESNFLKEKLVLKENEIIELQNQFKLSGSTFKEELSDVQHKVAEYLNCLQSIQYKCRNVGNSLSSIGHGITSFSSDSDLDFTNEKCVTVYFENIQLAINSIDTILQIMKDENERLNSNNSSLTCNNKSLSEKVSQMTSHIAELEQTKGSESDNMSLVADMDKIVSAVLSTEKTNEKNYQNVESHFNSLLQKFQQASTNVLKLHKIAVKLQQEQSNLEKENEQFSLEINLLKHSLAEMEIERNVLERQNEKLNVKTNLLQWSSSEASANSEEEIKLLRNQIASLNLTIEVKDKELQAASDNSYRLRLEIESINRRNAEVRFKNSDYSKNLEKECIALKNKLQCCYLDMTSMSKKHDQESGRKQDEIRILKEKIKSALEKATTESTLLKDCQEELQRLEEEKLQLMQVIEDERNDFVDRNTLLVHDNESFNASILELNEKLKLETSCLVTVRHEKDKLEHELLQLKESIQEPQVPLTETVSSFVVPEDSKLEHEMFQRTSAVQEDKEVLLKEIDSYKSKYDKMLVKLKIVRNKNESLTQDLERLQLVHANCSPSSQDNEQKLQNMIEEMKLDYFSYRNEKEQEINELSQHDTTLRKNCDKFQIELEDSRKCLSKSLQMSDLQKQNMDTLQQKLIASNQSLSDLNTSYNNLQVMNQNMQSKFDHQQKHVDMLISDNSTYQEVIERSQKSNSNFEDELRKQKDDFEKQKQDIESHFRTEFDRLQKAVEKENKFHVTMEKERDDFYEKNKLLQFQLAESQNVKAQLEDLVESSKQQIAENQKMEVGSKTDVITHENLVQSADITNIELNYVNQIQELKSLIERNEQDLEKFLDMERFWKDENFKLELHYKEVTAHYENEVSSLKEGKNAASDINLRENVGRLEGELYQAMSSLHKQSLRCDELSSELNRLLDERTSLRLKVNQVSDQSQQWQLKCQEYEKIMNTSQVADLPSDNGMVSIQVDMPIETDKKVIRESYQSTKEDLELIKKRLLETEATCKELRRANEALDNALRVEQDQRKLVEDELGYVHKQINLGDKDEKDEYRLLLSDLEEPEMLVETNFSLSRRVKSHTQKARRWLRGRKIYIHRLCQRKKYSELIYLFYICALHLWLLSCIFRHS